MSALRKTARALAWVVIVTIGLGGTLLLALLLFARTDAGHRTALGILLPRVRDKLSGDVRIGSIEGDLLSGLVLNDIEIDDAQGRPAIRVARLTLRYALHRLLKSIAQVELVKAEGGWVAPMRLAHLARPSESPGKAFGLILAKVVADAKVALVPRPEEAQVHVEGNLQLSDVVDMHIDQLDSMWNNGAWASARGRARVDGIDSVLSRVEVAARADLGKLAPDLRGNVEGYAELDGPLHSLLARARLRPQRGQIDASARLDLSRTEPLGRVAVRAEGIEPRANYAPAPAGRVSLDLTLERKTGQIAIAGTARARGLAASGVSAERVDVQIKTVNLEGTLALAAHHARLGQLALDQLVIRAAGTPDRLALDVDSQGPATRLSVHAHGAPRHALILDALAIQRRGTSWRSTGPAELSVALGEQVSLTGLRLASGLSTLSLSARYQLSDGAIDAQLRGERLDARSLARLFVDRPSIPSSDLSVSATVAGKSSAPRVDLLVSGWVMPDEPYPHTEMRLHAQLADQRVRGELTASAAGNALFVRANVPLAARGRDSLDADAHLVLTLDRSTRALWPPAAHPLENLRADVTLQARGTFANPELAAHFQGNARTAQAIDTRTRFHLEYRHGHLDARVTARATSPNHKPLGTLEAEAAAPVRLSLEARRVRLRGLDTAALSGAAMLSNLDLGELRALGVDLPADGKLDARLLADYAHGRINVDAEGLLDQVPFLRVSGNASLSPDRLDHWRTTPVNVAAHVPAFPLSHLPRLIDGIEGVLTAEARLTGTIDHPDAMGELRVSALHFGASSFDQVLLTGAYDGERIWAGARATQGPGARLQAAALIPLDADAPLAIIGRIDKISLDMRSESLPVVRRVRAILDGEIHAEGTRAQPIMNGRLALRDGVFAFKASPLEYRNVVLSATLRDQRLVLKELAVSAGDGHARAYGNAALEGFALRNVELHLISQRFPLSIAGLGGWLDTQVDADAARDPAGTHAHVLVRDGTLKLPNISKRRGLQSTAPLSDVVFTDQPPKPKQPRKPAQPYDLVTKVPGPFRLRSPEGSIDLGGTVRVTNSDGTPAVSGSIHALGGWIELFGRRFQVERLKVGFDGSPEPDPQLDIRLTRQVADAVIAVELYGSAKHPRLAFNSDPPVYSESQVIGIVVSGDAGNQRVSERSLDQQAIGALSSLLVGKIKDEIAPQLPIDVIKIGSSATGDTRLEAGKYVTDDIYVGYVLQLVTQVTTRPVNRNEAQVDYRVLRNYHLETRFGDAGAGSIDLYWTRRF